MFFKGLGLQILLKIADFQSKYRFQNRSQSQLVFVTRFLTCLEHFWSHFGIVLGPFWSLGGSLGYFWETLGIVWLQLGGLGCSLVALDSHFGLRNRFLIDLLTDLDLPIGQNSSKQKVFQVLISLVSKPGFQV